MRTTEFREHVRDEERFHHAEDGGALFGDDVAYRADHTESSFLVLRVFFIRSTNHS